MLKIIIFSCLVAGYRLRSDGQVDLSQHVPTAHTNFECYGQLQKQIEVGSLDIVFHEFILSPLYDLYTQLLLSLDSSA